MPNNSSADHLKELTDKLEQGIKELFSSGAYADYLKTMSKFTHYSFNNTMLIFMQKPDASLIAGYGAWQKNFERQVNRGERGIRILAPTPYKAKITADKLDPKTKKPVIGPDGKVEVETVEVTRSAFRPVTVFDVSQTSGKELPSLGVDELTGTVKDYELFFCALENVSPVPVEVEKITSGAKGYFSTTEQRIALNDGMSEVQSVKTLIHEITHAKLHNYNLEAEKSLPEAQRKDRRTKEVEAESVAYTVCQHYGIETSDYSFAYVAGWSQNKELPELKASMNLIRSTAAELISDIDEQARLLAQEKEAARSGLAEDAFLIYQIKDDVPELAPLRFESMDSLKKDGRDVSAQNYQQVYAGALDKGTSLDDLYERFNLCNPDDFYGHSMSVSDVIILRQDGQETAYYCDSFGFAQLPKFFENGLYQPQEMALKVGPQHYLSLQESDSGYDYTLYGQNYQQLDGGQIDNVDCTINQAAFEVLKSNALESIPARQVDYAKLQKHCEAVSTSKVAELTAKLTAGEHISVMEMTKAAKHELGASIPKVAPKAVTNMVRE